MLPNLERIREVGLEVYLSEQRERRLLCEHLLAEYNEGRSMTFHCTACALMPPSVMRDAVSEMASAVAGGQADHSDIKARSKAFKSLVRERAQQRGIDLRLRRTRKG
jgi:hypothetical protein